MLLRDGAPRKAGGPHAGAVDAEIEGAARARAWARARTWARATSRAWARARVWARARARANFKMQ